MIFEAQGFAFEPPPQVAFARKVLIKPHAATPQPYPATTSKEILAEIIAGIRRVSDADITLLEGSRSGESVYGIYRALGYDFPRVFLLDVRDCTFVEVENPLPRPFAMSTFWVPNILLSCDYSITVAPFKVEGGRGNFSISNLLGLLPLSKYGGEDVAWELWDHLGLHNLAADLYFTLTFDLGVIDARKKLIEAQAIEDYGKIFIAPPYDVDYEASQACGVETQYLRLIEKAKTGTRG
jgi:hypothetical protein